VRYHIERWLYGRCASCNADHVHKMIEQAHKDAVDSTLRFGG